jgi:O-antigen/teichoic acid export membrane protein
MADSTHIRGTFKHAVIYSLSSISEKAAGFIMLPVYTHLLGAEVYGILQMIEVVTTVLAILAGYAMASALNRLYYDDNSEEQRHILVSTFVIVMFLLTVVVCLPTLYFSKPIAELTFGKGGSQYYIVLGILSFFASTTSLSGQMYILQKQKPILFSMLSFAKFLLAFALNIYLIIFLRLGIEGVLYSELITGALYSLYVHIYTLNSTGLHFNIDKAKAVLKYSLPLMPGYLATFIRSNTDRIILRSYLGLAQLGVYSTVLKFSLLTGVIFHEPFMRIWAVKRMEIADTQEGPQTISKMFSFYMAVSLFLGLFLSLEIPALIRLMTPEEFWVSSMVAFFAVVSRIGFSSYFQFYFGLLYGKATAKISLIQIISAVINVGISITFIKHYGILGACIGSSLVYIIQCIITHFMAQKYYPIRYQWDKILMLIAISLVLFLIIDPLSVKQMHWEVWLNDSVLPFCIKICGLLHVASIRDGKLIIILTDKFPIVVECAVKAILSLLFIPALFFLKILRWDTCVEIVNKFFLKIRISSLSSRPAKSETL